MNVPKSLPNVGVRWPLLWSAAPITFASSKSGHWNKGFG
jgi:hypothetical protein